MYKVKLKKNEEKRILEGQTWVFANEVSTVTGKDVQGSVCQVISFDDRSLGYGVINHSSKILVRILDKEMFQLDYDFFFARISEAKKTRENLGFDNNYRAVFSESDNLSGLIVDKYADVLSIQVLSLAFDLKKDIIVKVLIDIFQPKAIYERSDVSVREKEGLPKVKQLLYGTLDGKVEIIENGIKILVDVENGQKTGYFLDQKSNRANLAKYVKGKTVLDCFCNTGGFSLHAAKYKAKSIEAVDVSALALNTLLESAILNKFKQITCMEGDAFNVLKQYKNEGKKFDVVILDPPAFTKTVDTIKGAVNGYHDININGLKIVNSGGIFITCSCSQHLSIPMFINIIKESAHKARRRIKILEFCSQSPDHAVDIALDESLYLKCIVAQVI